jgi:hypothetical protein
MPPIVEVPVRSRSALISLFEEHRRDRAFIDCVLEGHFGTARADRVSAPTRGASCSCACSPIGSE